mgnify:CR=1 FL=1
MKKQKALLKTVITLTLLILPTFVFSQNWTVRESLDEMTDELTVYITSTEVMPTKPMSFPYEDTKSSLCIGMTKDSIWVYFWFSSGPNISNMKFDKNYTKPIVDTRVKFDKDIETNRFVISESSFIHVPNREYFLKRLLESKEFLLELEWYGVGSVYFRYNLSGLYEAFVEGCTKTGNTTYQSPVTEK